MKVAINIVLFIALVFIRGVTVMLGWQWFAVPLGLPAIGFAHALGLSTFAAILCSTISDKENDHDAATKLITGIVINAIGLASMFIYQLFM